MRKFLRLAGAAIVAASLLLSVATVLLWVRSHSTGDSFDRYRQDVAGRGTYHDTRGIFSTRGTIGVGVLRLYHPAAQDWPTDKGWGLNAAPATGVAWRHRWWLLGFGYWNTALPGPPGSGGMRMTGAKVPHWFVALVFAVAPALWGRRAWLTRRAGKRLRARLCVACGYDIRESGERCPECGTGVPKVIRASHSCGH